MKEYNLNFNGYWLNSRISGIPQTSGIYFVYRCTYDDAGVTLKELLYIGQANNLHDGISFHTKEKSFINKCQNEETLCYSVAEAPKNDLDIIENALIFAQQPVLNDKYKDKFRYDVPISFRLEGRCKLIKYQNFTIK